VHGIAADTRGNVYVADAAHRRVVKFSFANGPVVQIDSQQGSDHALTEPFKVAVDSQDRLYVLDVAAADVKRYLPDGTYQATLLQGIGMYSPRGLVVDTSDRLWIADTGRNRVLEVTPDGQLLREWDQVDGRDLDQPTSVAPDGSGGAYIAEPESGLVVHIDEAGQSLGSRHIAESDTRSGPDLLALGTGRVLMTDPQRGKLEVLGPGLQEGVDWVSATPPMAVTSTYAGDIWLMNAGADAPREIGIPPE
jgi:DNA-binding beta-propeller fold protein YncE